MAEVPNIQYARPIEIDYRPFQLYMQRKENERRAKLAQQQLDLRQQAAQQQALRQRQADMDRRLKEVGELGKYGMGGLWHDQISSAIKSAQSDLSQKIRSNDPSWRDDLMKYSQMLDGYDKKAKAFGDMVGQKIKDYGVNDAIESGALRSHMLKQFAFNPDGTLRNLGDIDLEGLSKYDPLLDPDADSYINNAAITDQLIDALPENSTSKDVSNRANGVTNSTSVSITAPSFARIDPITGKRTLNTEVVAANPEILDSLFDRYKDGNGKVHLIKEPVYQQALQNPLFRSKVQREIARHNQGLSPGDDDFVEAGSPDADLVGRAVLTNQLTGSERGKFKVSRKRGVNQSSGSGGGSRSTINADSLMQKLKGVYEQQPEYMKYNEESNVVPKELKDQYPNIIASNVTPIFKDLNVGLDAKSKPIPAQGIYVAKNMPGALFVDYGGGNIKGLSVADLPEWLQSIVPFNKGMDAQKIKSAFDKVFAGVSTQGPQVPVEPPVKQSVVQKAAGKVKSALKKLSGNSKQDTIDFRNQFKASN